LLKEISKLEGQPRLDSVYSRAMEMTSAYSMTRSDWMDLLSNLGLSPNILPFLIDGLYKERGLWERHLEKRLVEKITQDFDLSLPVISSLQESPDGTVKFLMKFKDSHEVETVLIPFYKRFTVCLSTQVGCGMNCSFCYTGTQGLKRNLSGGEIVGQYMVANQWLKEKNPSALKPSIVFMGQGEPLHNADEVAKSVHILNDPLFLGVGHRQITLSTVGYLKGLKSFHQFPRINLAFSLHSPFEKERSELIPLNEKCSLSEILPLLDEIPLLPRQFITYEYLLIKNFNMTDKHVEGLFELLGKRKAIINLIPFNPFPGSKWQRPDDLSIEEFKNKLVEKKLRVMIRRTKGSEILAACGQLKVNRLARDYGQR
jgi:23S rRNA (adenine2503-C2)-methyltransferase